MYLHVIILYLTSTKQFFLKHHNRNSYLCSSEPVAGQTILTECGFNKAIDFELEKKSDGLGLLSPINDSKTLDVLGSSQVILWGKHGHKKQQFQLIYTAPDRFAIVNDKKCVTRKGTGQHFMEPCDNSDEQQFVLIPNVKDKEKKVLPREFFPFRSFGGLFSSNNGILNKIGQLMKNNKTLARHLSKSHKDPILNSEPNLKEDTGINQTGSRIPSTLDSPQSINTANSPTIPVNVSPTNIDSLTGVPQDPNNDPVDQAINSMTDRTKPNEDTVDLLSRHNRHRVDRSNCRHGRSRGSRRGSNLLGSNLHGGHGSHDDQRDNGTPIENVTSHPFNHHGTFNRHNQHHHRNEHHHDHEEILSV